MEGEGFFRYFKNMQSENQQHKIPQEISKGEKKCSSVVSEIKPYSGPN